MLYQISSQQLKHLEIPAEQNGIIFVRELKGMDGLGHGAFHLLVGHHKLLVPLLHQQLLYA